MCHRKWAWPPKFAREGPLSLKSGYAPDNRGIEFILYSVHADTEGQKIAMFQFIAKNHNSLGITWSIIADTLRDIACHLLLGGNTALARNFQIVHS